MTYTINAKSGSFAVKGNDAALSPLVIQAGTGTVVINPPRTGFAIMLPPAVGTRLLWRNAGGQYHVVIP